MKKAAAHRPRFTVVTLFPRMFEGVFGESIIGKAREKGLVSIDLVNPRDHSTDRHRKVDDRPFGGGPGMIMMAEPLFRAIKDVRSRSREGSAPWVVHLSPQGRRFDAGVAAELAAKGSVVLVCGHYEGIDERLDTAFDDEISMGDFVLTGGEIAAMAVVDAVTRLLPGVLAQEAVQAESFFPSNGGPARLDHPHYTRPRVWRGRKVPAALLSGDHGRISEWRSRAAKAATRRKRPDLLRLKEAA
ncbi:MAG: tRNA (guanosine(37)-N1)-methyltransferase TrmD [Elusimicrobia bacterium]|nr:tRNA (guanosine(37)-N1)-methyltransferase TrmD [Elusimicrobiota bacterium]